MKVHGIGTVADNGQHTANITTHIKKSCDANKKDSIIGWG